MYTITTVSITGFRNPGRYPQNLAGFGVNPPKNPAKKRQKTYPKFNPVSFLVLLITKNFIMFKAFNAFNADLLNAYLAIVTIPTMKDSPY